MNLPVVDNWETIAAALAAAVNRPMKRRLPDEEELKQKALFYQLLVALERGDTGILVDETTRQWLLDQPWAGSGTPPTPVVVTGSFVQWYRYWQAEQAVTKALAARLALPTPALYFPEPLRAAATTWGLNPMQVAAITRMLAQPLTLLTGGPGTGKTTTLVWFLAALAINSDRLPSVALAAPTGKAAQRMSEAIAQALTRLPLTGKVQKELAQLPTQTLHRLLGIGYTPQPRYTAANPLPYDWVIIDEASMVDLLLLDKVVAALAPRARLILMGDPNQLASVEAGSVLADLVAYFPACHVPLTSSHRFGAAIAALANRVLAGETEAAWSMIAPAAGANAHNSDVTLLPATPQALVAAADKGYAPYLDHLRKLTATPLCKSKAAVYAQALLEALSHFRIVTPLRHHQHDGADALNELLVDHWHRRHGLPLVGDRLLLGHALQITANDYTTGLFNGDLGVLLPTANGLAAWFTDPSAAGGMRAVSFTQLPRWESAWVSTVHKAQGSEFTEVLLYLPEATPIASREFLYTAITRAKQRFYLATRYEAFADALARSTQRLSSWRVAARA